MRAVGDPDAFMPTDLGVRQAFTERGLDARPRAVVARSEAWRPWPCATPSPTAGGVVVVGAGFIGLEVAATARARGRRSPCSRACPSPLVRALGAEMGTAATAARAATASRSAATCGSPRSSAPAGVRLADGDVVPADVVVVGIGVAPVTAWLEGSGLRAARRRRVRRHAGRRAGRACSPPATWPAGRTRVRRGDAPRALDQRRRAGRRWPPATCWPWPRAGTPRPTCRCRSSGATSTTPASSSSAARPTTRATSSPGRQPRSSVRRPLRTAGPAHRRARASTSPSW